MPPKKKYTRTYCKFRNTEGWTWLLVHEQSNLCLTTEIENKQKWVYDVVEVIFRHEHDDVIFYIKNETAYYYEKLRSVFAQHANVERVVTRDYPRHIWSIHMTNIDKDMMRTFERWLLDNFQAFKQQKEGDCFVFSNFVRWEKGYWDEDYEDEEHIHNDKRIIANQQRAFTPAYLQSAAPHGLSAGAYGSPVMYYASHPIPHPIPHPFPHPLAAHMPGPRGGGARVLQLEQ